MPHSGDFGRLLDLLQELGVPAIEAGSDEATFPVEVPLAGGHRLVLGLPEPGLVASLDPRFVGAAILDQVGCARQVWGLARDIPHFSAERSLLMTPIGGLMEGTIDGQGGGSIYLEGNRYFSGSLNLGPSAETLILVLGAAEESAIRSHASQSQVAAETLRRLGKALTSHQTRQPMCVAAAHELAASLDLAAVMIWAREHESGSLQLMAGVGVNRQAAAALKEIGKSSSGCVAELVASSRRSFHVDDVYGHVLTANVEARSFYLKPGAVSVHPLLQAEHLLGVLELVAKENAEPTPVELYETIAEHLALALNSATMFENVERWASHDSVTGIANHRALQEFLHARLLEAERNDRTLGAMMIDVDHFRAFNEEEGHDAGDEVLRLVAQAIKSCVRSYDLAARYGGEEFCVIAPNCSKGTLMNMAERIRERVSAAPFHTRTGQVRHVTVSLGCAHYPTAGSDAPSLLKAADRALFQAKRKGRDRVVYYDRRVQSAERAGPDLERLWSWVLAEDRAQAQGLRDRLESYSATLTGDLRLTQAQAEILRAMAVVARSYLRAVKEDAKLLREMEASEEFRTLLPGLQGLRARFDNAGGQGSRIPLLSRILAVLMAFQEPDAKTLAEDPGRFDPEVVAILAQIDPAA